LLDSGIPVDDKILGYCNPRNLLMTNWRHIDDIFVINIPLIKSINCVWQCPWKWFLKLFFDMRFSMVLTS
jgi:hypothetical protein